MIAAREPTRGAAISERRLGGRHRWLWPALAITVVLACILIANPFNEVGFCDDWSYGWTARRFAASGHLEYNGWGSPILLFQTLWALPWLRILGSSAKVLQVSMIPLALGYVLLVYATGRLIGVPPRLACFASLAVGTSPLFLPLAASFMTDVSGCLFSLLSIHAALRGAPQYNAAGSVRWLWILAVVGTLGGANRQIVWVAPIALIPYLVWVWRHNARFVRHAAAAYLLCTSSIAVIQHLFAQPYPAAQLTWNQLASLLHSQSGAVVELLVNLVMTAFLVSLPVFFCFVPLAFRGTRSAAILTAGIAVALTTAEFVFAGILAPYGQNILTFDWLPMKVLPLWTRILLSLLTNCCIAVLVHLRPRAQRGERQPSILWPFWLFSLGYAALLLPGILTQFAFDRYTLPLVPLMALPALRRASPRMSSPPLVAWLCLTVFAWYSVGVTHDYFENLRARIASAQRLEATGVRRVRISAGFEYDGTTALERTGRVIGAGLEDRLVDNTPKGFWPEFWNHTRGFCPDFVVLDSYSRIRDPKVILKTPFRAWLPPFQRSAVVWKRSDLTAMFYDDLKRHSPHFSVTPSSDSVCSSGEGHP